MNPSLGNSNPSKDRDRLRLNPFRKPASANEFLDFAETATVLTAMILFMRVSVTSSVRVGMSRVVAMRMVRVPVPVMLMESMRVGFALMGVAVAMRQMNIELGARNPLLGAPRHVQVIALQREFTQFSLQFRKIHPQVQQGPDEHVATDPAKKVEVKLLHDGINFDGSLRRWPGH